MSVALAPVETRANTPALQTVIVADQVVPLETFCELVEEVFTASSLAINDPRLRMLGRLQHMDVVTAHGERHLKLNFLYEGKSYDR